MTGRLVRVLPAVYALVAPFPVWAQGAASAQQAASAEQEVVEQRVKIALDGLTVAGQEVMSEGSPTDRAAAGFVKPTIQFSSEGGENEVSFAFSLDVDSYRPQRVRENFYRVGRTRLSLVASAPIDENEALSRLFAGDSLISGSRLKLSLSHLTASLGSGEGARPFIEEAYRACISQNAAAWQKQHESEAGAANAHQAFISAVGAPANQGQLGLALPRLAKADPASAEPKTPANGIEAFVYNACFPSLHAGALLNDAVELVDTYTDRGEDFADLFYDKRSYLTFFGIDASLGRDDYEYLDRAAFELTDTTNSNWEVGAYAGVINSSLTFSARARIVYGRTYEAAEDVEVCHILADTMQQLCLTGPDGVPARKDEGIISLETRHLFSLDEGNRIALAPQLTYRFEDDSFGVEIPIYLATDKERKLTGGVKLAYNSKAEDEFGIGLFVGIPFSILFD